MVWGEGFYLICMGPARFFWRLATGMLFSMFESALPLLLFLPYLWQDLKTLEGSSMERAVKKRKSDTSQPIKKGKGKQIDSSSESEEVSESDDDEIEAMFAEASDSESKKWA